jgi:hypothetical protein
MPFLSGLLVVQLALVGFLLTRKDAGASFQPNEKLLSFNFDKVDRLQITDASGKKLEMKKLEGSWVIPEYFNYPVATKKLETFGQSLDSFKRSWPLGTTAIAAKQFKVVPEQFERELVFFAGDKKLQTLYLGTSPSFRKVHARVDEVMTTYSIEQNTFDIPVESKEWVDKKFFAALDKTKVKALAISGVTLNQQNGEFLLNGISENQETKTDKTAALINKVLNADFDEVFNQKDQVNLGEKVNSFTLTTNDDQVLAFDVYKLPASPAAKAAAEEAAAAKAKKDAKDAKKDALKEPKKDEPKAPEDLVVVHSQSPYAFKVKEQKIKDLFKVESSELVKAKGSDGANAAKDAAPTPPNLGALTPESK